MVWEDFWESLMKGNHDMHVCMGDLFDKWSVPYDVVYRAAEYYKKAASLINVDFYIIRGNHDISLDLERHGAFDVFRQIMEGVPRVTVVHDQPVMANGLLMIPWHPTKFADELVQPCEYAAGHWDTVFGKANMIPTEALAAAGCRIAYTGHVHQKGEFDRDGVHVVQVGSLQPYAHGEEGGDDSFYRTVTLAELEELTDADTHNLCLRVKLQAGEVLDRDIDCLQLTVQRESEGGEEIDVTLGDFDLPALFTKAFTQENVPEPIRARVLARYEESRIAA